MKVAFLYIPISHLLSIYLISLSQCFGCGCILSPYLLMLLLYSVSYRWTVIDFWYSEWSNNVKSKLTILKFSIRVAEVFRRHIIYWKRLKQKPETNRWLWNTHTYSVVHTRQLMLFWNSIKRPFKLINTKKNSQKNRVKQQNKTNYIFPKNYSHYTTHELQQIFSRCYIIKKYGTRTNRKEHACKKGNHAYCMVPTKREVNILHL